VDYQDVHLDRFTRAGQEYNLAHRTLAGIQEAVQAVAAGNGLDRVGILDPLVTVSGFCYGELLADAGGQGAALRTSLRPFPPRLQAELQRVLRSRHTAQLGDLDKFAQRADWLSFYSALVAAVRLVMQALFAMHGVYYPGDKWLRQALLRFGLDQRILAAYDRVWAPGVAAVERIAAYRELLELAKA
jgi:hypothetical protein